MTAETISPLQTEETNPPLTWLTGEVFVYVLIGLLALGLHLYNLGLRPLNDAEAANAVAALSIYHGDIPQPGTYSPLMTSLTAVSFFLFGPSDWSARLASALLGTILVLLPFGLRRRLGLLGAMISAGLLTISASVLFASRLLSGDIGAGLGLLLVLAGGARWLGENRANGLYIIATGLVFLLLSSPVGYTALFALIALLGIVSLINRAFITTLRDAFSQAGITLRRALAWFAGLLLVLATAFFFNLSGLVEISNLFTQWLGQFGLQAVAGAGYPAFFLLLFYEPLIVVFGVIGVIATLWNRHLLDWLLAIWLAVVIILDLLMAGRSGGQVLLLVLPLALLAGRQIAQLVEDWRWQAKLDSEGLLAGIGLMVSVFIYISLTSWSRCTDAQAGCSTAWVLPLAGTLLIVGLTAVFWVWYGRGVALRGLGALTLIVTLLLSLGSAWRLNYSPLKDLPYQPMVQLSASSRLPTLIAEIERLSMERVGDPHMINLAVVDLDTPMLRWYTRDFERAHFETDFSSASASALVLARPEAGEPLGGAYVGQEYALIAHWNPNLVKGKDWLRWYLYRTLPNHIPGTDQVVLWANVGN